MDQSHGMHKLLQEHLIWKLRERVCVNVVNYFVDRLYRQRVVLA